MSTEVFGVTRIHNKFSLRKAQASAELICVNTTLNRQIFGVLQINSKRYVN